MGTEGAFLDAVTGLPIKGRGDDQREGLESGAPDSDPFQCAPPGLPK